MKFSNKHLSLLKFLELLKTLQQGNKIIFRNSRNLKGVGISWVSNIERLTKNEIHKTI